MRRMAKIEFMLLALFSGACVLFAPPAIVGVYVSFSILFVTIALIV